MKKILTPFLLCIFLIATNNFAVAETVWADDSINEVIINQYDTKAIEKEFLPTLPESLKNEGNNTTNLPKVESTTYSPAPATQHKATTSSTTKPQTYTYTKQTSTKTYFPSTNNQVESRNYVSVKKGTKFWLRIEQPIDDSARIGSNVYFTSLYPEINNYVTIPRGTKFIGLVTDSHLPQMSANGGLLVIAINKMVYKGRAYPIKATVVMVGDKRVFQNNIKGKHKYWKGVADANKFGVNFYSKSWQVTKKFAGEGLEIILTPITFVGGVMVMAGNAVASPVIALFSKGGRLFIKKGTHFEIRLLEDTAIRL